MATQKVTVTLDAEVVARIKALVAEGRSSSVSGFVQQAVVMSLDELSGWEAMLAEALAATGGPVTDAERAWADEQLSGSGHPARRTA